MATKEEKRKAYHELVTPILNAPAQELFYFTTDFMHQLENMGNSVFVDEAGKIKSYHPSDRTEKLGKVFDIARNDLPSFILSAAPQNVTDLMCVKTRKKLLETMLDMGLENRIRDFIAPPAPTRQTLKPGL